MAEPMTVEEIVADIIATVEDNTRTICRIVTLDRAIAKHGRPTGDLGSLSVEEIPAGWATATYLVARDAEPTDYFGPVLDEDDLRIWLEIGGQPIPFPKSRVIITRSLAA